MERLSIIPRTDWRARVEKLGLAFHSDRTVYWNESACYRFTAAEVDVIEAATNELYRLCLAAVQHVIEHKLYALFGIPERYAPLIVDSWERDDLSLYGRFDLYFDGRTPPRMYEFNADTPTSLLEASVIQWHWLQDYSPSSDQFNSIHERLIARWQEGGVGNATVHFACVRNQVEDYATTLYLEDTAMQAGLATKRLFIDEIGWDGSHFVDLEKQRITHLFKLYPWEWLIDETFSPHLIGAPWRVIEPAWKMLLSNKAILPLLWEMFPGHPNLLPSYLAPDRLGGNYVRKPTLGREGANITQVVGGMRTGPETPGNYSHGQFIFQSLLSPPNLFGSYPVVGSWIVGDEAAGIGVRESNERITSNSSPFVPHFFVD